MITYTKRIHCEKSQYPGPSSSHGYIVGRVKESARTFSVTHSSKSKYTRGLFLERPGNLIGPKSYFEIKVSRKVECALTSNEVHFVSFADNFTVQLPNVLKLPSEMENKTS